MNAIEQYFPVVLFITLYKVILTFESVDEIPNFDHSNESYRAGILWYYLSNSVAAQGGSPKSNHSNKAL